MHEAVDPPEPARRRDDVLDHGRKGLSRPLRPEEASALPAAMSASASRRQIAIAGADAGAGHLRIARMRRSVDRASSPRGRRGICATANSCPEPLDIEPRRDDNAGRRFRYELPRLGGLRRWIMVVVGSLDALWGLGGILNDDVVVVGGHGAILADITTWGWVHLILVGHRPHGRRAAGRQRGGPVVRHLLRRRERGASDRVVPRGAAVGVPDHHPRRHDHLPADRSLERPGALGLTPPAESARRRGRAAGGLRVGNRGADSKRDRGR